MDPILTDAMYCYSNGTLMILDPILCYETENSPFLGLYYTEDEILKRKLVETKIEIFSPSRYFTSFKPVKPLGNKYKYGVPLRFNENGNVVNLPSDVLGKGYCDHHLPIRFLVGSDSVCMSEISPEQCVGNPRFQLETYFKENRNGLKLPDIFSGAGAPVSSNMTVQCGHDIFEIDDFAVVNDILEECGNMTKIRRTEFDVVRQVCEHVVTQVEYHFTWHENSIVALDILVGLSEVSTVPSESHVPSRKGRNPRVSQLFKTEFYQEETKSSSPQHTSYNLHDGILLHHL